MRHVSVYGCVLCQTCHVEGDPLYEPHHYHQDKHGLTRMWAPHLAMALGHMPAVCPTLGDEAVPLWRSLTYRQYARTRAKFER